MPTPTPLRAVYNLHEQVVSCWETACRLACDVCCTADVIMTTLEGRVLGQEGISRGEIAALAPVVGKHRPPPLSVNRLAEILAAGDDPPKAIPPNATGRCPLLRTRRCRAYLVRPFHCRAMVSRIPCKEGDAAEMTTFMVTVNTVFLQVIEHMDAEGYSGYMVDVLRYLFLSKPGDDPKSFGLVPNRPLSVLMIPPEDRPRMAPILSALKQIRV